MTNKRINIGVLGCASIAQRSMIPAILALNTHFNLIGIASRDPERAKCVASKFNIEAYDGYEALLDHPRLDAVYVPLPNALHAKWIERSLKKDLHVLAEKSLACNLKDVVHLNQLARDRNLVLLESFQFRFHRQMDFIRQLIKKGTIGELRSLRSSFGFPPFADKTNIRYDKRLGGGALLDAGAYPLKAAQIFLGEDLKVKAASLCYDARKGVDIWGGAYLHHNKSNVFAQVAFGFDHYYQCNLELWGSKGKITTGRIFTAPAGHRAVIEVETPSGKKIIKVPCDNAFNKILKYFVELVIHKKGMEDEYRQNINQARLIAEVRTKADEK